MLDGQDVGFAGVVFSWKASCDEQRGLGSTHHKVENNSLQHLDTWGVDAITKVWIDASRCSEAPGGIKPQAGASWQRGVLFVDAICASQLYQG